MPAVIIIALRRFPTLQRSSGWRRPLGLTISNSVAQYHVNIMQRTTLSFQSNSHLATLSATIIAVKPATSLEASDKSLFPQAQENDHVVITNATIFHPQGGGQPSDQGTMQDGTGVKFQVETVRMAATTPGVALHLGRFAEAATSFAQGEQVTQNIDTEKRLLYSRYHTAGHVLGSAVRYLLEAKVENFDEIKASHFPGSASCEFTGSIDGKWKSDIQEKLDALIDEDLPVEIDWWDEEDFRKAGLERLIPDRSIMNMEEGEKFRVVKIVGAEIYPCGGTHVDGTKACGKTVVKKISRTKGTSRVSYQLD